MRVQTCTSQFLLAAVHERDSTVFGDAGGVFAPTVHAVLNDMTTWRCKCQTTDADVECKCGAPESTKAPTEMPALHKLWFDMRSQDWLENHQGNANNPYIKGTDQDAAEFMQDILERCSDTKNKACTLARGLAVGLQSGLRCEA
eukprot:gene3690-760_t